MDNCYAIACDLGTGGCKSALYDQSGCCVSELFVGYNTCYPQNLYHEQRPEDWWSAVKESIIKVLENIDDDVKHNVVGIGLSRHSLGMIPLSNTGELLLESVPIWSDSRPTSKELEPFFEIVPEEEWYMITGNGFPAQLYTVFKILWFKNNYPELFNKTHKIVGTKDYINYLLSGNISTDYSYVSGTGIYDLLEWDYSEKLLSASGLSRELFPDIIPSTAVVGNLQESIAAELGLPASVKVVSGGVDNACMALGARCYEQGRVYNSLGSSSWIAVSADKPVLDPQKRPYVFTHVVPGQFTSATAIFAAGSCYKWFKQLFADEQGEGIGYDILEKEVADIKPGSEKLIFNPSLAGGSSLDSSTDIKGAFLGLSLGHKRAHMARSVMEGVAFGLRRALDALSESVEIDEEMILVGGGSMSPAWRGILADIYDMKIVKSCIDQQAASLGAAALVMVGCEVWDDFSAIDRLHELEAVCLPDTSNREQYDSLYNLFCEVSEYLSQVSEKFKDLP